MNLYFSQVPEALGCPVVFAEGLVVVDELDGLRRVCYEPRASPRVQMVVVDSVEN